MRFPSPFRNGLLLLSLLLGCMPSLRATGPDSVKILSWNVYLLPNPPVMFHGQDARCRRIIPVLQQGDWDVVVLQEVFMPRHRRMLMEGLREQYPYAYGPTGSRRFLRQDGGVLVLSRTPALAQDSIVFDRGCAGSDCYAQKGAVFVELEKNGRRYQVVGTHTQSMDAPEAREIRRRQYAQIFETLLRPRQRARVPQFIVGDMNTDLGGDSLAYADMLSAVDALDAGGHDRHRREFTYDDRRNDLIPDDKPGYGRQVLDYILYRPNQMAVKVKSFAVRVFRSPWKKGRQDLADHFAVESVFVLEED